MLASRPTRSPEGSPPQGSPLPKASNPRAHTSSTRGSLTPVLSAPNPQTTHNHKTPTVRSIQTAAHHIVVWCCTPLTHGRRGSSGKTGQSRAALCGASTPPPVMHTMRHCSLQVAAASWTELDELILERGAVALCPHATWRAQLLAYVLVPEAGIRANEEHITYERTRLRPTVQCKLSLDVD